MLGLVLMASQAFVYNAIFFTYALVLTRFYGVAADRVGLYILPFAVGNFLGPLLLGPLFNSLGRKTMIFATYGLSGVLLALTAQLFHMGVLDATTQTAMWSVVFFFASAAASAAYLTVGECFPLEIRALTIALFYAFGTLLGGVGGPWLFGVLIESDKPGRDRAGLPAGRGADDRGRPGRPEARRQRRAPVAGGGGAAAVAAVDDRPSRFCNTTGLGLAA